ncbi:MAG: hypothetical protein WBZ37_29745, partial [Mycobacterium sp.]
GNVRAASLMLRSEQPLSTTAIMPAAAVARIMVANPRVPLPTPNVGAEPAHVAAHESGDAVSRVGIGRQPTVFSLVRERHLRRHRDRIVTAR